MSTCFLMHPNGFLFAMSRHALGGNGRPPRDADRPSRGSQSVQSIRRKLFGDVDHRQTSIDLDRELRQCEAEDRSKYNFDFNSEQPINSPDSRYEWSQISNDINDPEDNVSTNISKTCDISKNMDVIAQSSTQSAISSAPETEPYKAVSPTVSPTLTMGSNSSQSPTPSATSAPDSQSQSSSSNVELTSKVGQKHKSVTRTKQNQITAYFDGRKSNQSQRKRSAAHERQTSSKRHRLECSSAVKPEDIDTTTDDRDTDVRAD